MDVYGNFFTTRKPTKRRYAVPHAREDRGKGFVYWLGGDFTSGSPSSKRPMPWSTFRRPWIAELISPITLGTTTRESPGEEWERLSKDDETKYPLCRGLTDLRRGPRSSSLMSHCNDSKSISLTCGNFTRTSDWKTPIGSLRTAAHMKRRLKQGKRERYGIWDLPDTRIRACICG